MKVVQNPDLVAADMDGDVVMMSVETGAYFGLTGVAPHIWQVLETPHTVEALVAALFSQFEVDKAELQKDVDDFLAEMIENGLVHTV